ncbi:hypothetical protein GCM10017044_12680 [Kordiimonas sediminis]|uniref:Sulfotransferase n=1 Tax=Kordiimonas sediminis TaxID=1735581 RepID=A0A919APW3_9PROT|nr:sulfotransferase [Kordiimonas sediminis]GHF19485.1 hypothetical protein GCM10017044_12680 [Kordiimonas sediminis]
MSAETQPVFIIGCGRSGTQSMARFLNAFQEADCEHEYQVLETQKLGTLKYAGLVNSRECIDFLRTHHEAAVHYSQKQIWGDSSNKLAWMIPEVHQVFPQAKFIHLTRDGRKVTSSLYHKLGDEVMDDHSMEIMQNYLRGTSQMCPPPEKKYWWPSPLENDPAFPAFQTWDHFARICWHWREINQRILDDFSHLPPANVRTIKLEDITSSRQSILDLSAFLGLSPTEEQIQLLGRPYNVVRPENNPLNDAQTTAFQNICGSMQEMLGYQSREEYTLNYSKNSLEKDAP